MVAEIDRGKSLLFEGSASLRHPTERLAFSLTLLWAFPVAAIVGVFIHFSIGLAQVALFVVGAMVFITFARGRLIGSSVLIHEAQNPEIFSIVKRQCAALGLPLPLVFVRQDPLVPAAAIGFGEPYSLVLSSEYLEELREDELSFVIGRQLGHIAAGHVRYQSLLSVNGNENALVSLIFGPWLRRCELTCDKVGLICCGSLDAASRAIAILALRGFGRQVDLRSFATQQASIGDDTVLKWGEWLGSEPYATRRIAELTAFAASAQYERYEEWFLRSEAVAPIPLPLPGSRRLDRGDLAGRGRRILAAAIDVVVLLAASSYFTLPASSHSPKIPRAVVVNGLPNGANVQLGPLSVNIPAEKTAPAASSAPTPVPTASPTPSPQQLAASATARLRDAWNRTLEGLARRSLSFGFASFLYFALLIAIVGQSFGMMIAGLRVSSLDLRRPSFGQALARGVLIGIFHVLIALLAPFTTCWFHDWMTKTRVVAGERLIARVANG
ncbi:MAG: M48 family metalloprotease [Candidatus Eremiobacteraeota bacterium]|nr:M48 family metalloprotease [Candidatus Eremiobacteraeota bacterium]NNM93472.1 M48 family metalloprotease [Candidatus Eremiobacteraeota bacterium]